MNVPENIEKMTTREAALAYAAEGVRVFPCVPKTKGPYVAGGNSFKDATTDAVQIETWWKTYPDAAIGTPDFDVLDVEGADGTHAASGFQSLKALQDQHGKLPDTLTSLTPSGGQHIYLRDIDAGSRVIGWKTGIDVLKRDAGYVILPPSQNGNGRSYQWLSKKAIADSPAYLKVGGEAFKPSVVPMRETTARNSSLHAKLRAFRREFESEEALYVAAKEINALAVPPLDDAEVRKIVRKAWTQADRPDFVPRATEDVAPRVRWGNTVELRSREWFYEPFFERNRLGLLTGRSGAGKGTWLADMIARVTRGELGERTKVMYLVASEDDSALDVLPRIAAAGGLVENVALIEQRIIIPKSLPLLVDIAKEEIGEEELALIVLDPVRDFMESKNTNIEEDVTNALSPLSTLAKTLCNVIGVRHLTEKEAADIRSAVQGHSAWVQIPRNVCAIVEDPDDPDLRHVQSTKSNTSKTRTGGHTFRIEPTEVDGLEMPVTRAVILGESEFDISKLFRGDKTHDVTKTASAEEKIFDLLEASPTLSMESDMLNAQVAKEVGCSVPTVKNAYTALRDKGLAAKQQARDQFGKVTHWEAYRTSVPRDFFEGDAA